MDPDRTMMPAMPRFAPLYACTLAACLLLIALPPAHAATPARATMQAAPLVIGETFTLESAALGETRRINVYLPAAYQASPDTRLPVLYMPDGGIAEDFLHVAGLVQVLTGNGSMRPFVLVGIENTERRRDLTGPTEDPEDRKIAPRVGGSAAFRAFVRDELMPQVRSRYRTTDEAAIVGESLAGLFVLETLALEPELFDTYIAIDPSVWWNRNALVDTAPQWLDRQPDGTNTKVFVATGREATASQPTTRLLAAMNAHASPGLQITHRAFNDETHATVYHAAALDAFRKAFAPEAKPAGH
jgi:predicted alpha/beta superfamily hydrolase